jgi:hemoglobin-like flavoprotein
MSLDVQLLRDSFALVLDREPALTSKFYDTLFSRYPQAQPLFSRNGRRRQEDMLAQALVAVVDHLEDPHWLSSTLEILGAKHVDYGVTDEMFDWVGDSLIATLAEAAGDEWTPATAAAWAVAYGAISAMMKRGMARARSAA